MLNIPIGSILHMEPTGDNTYQMGVLGMNCSHLVKVRLMVPTSYGEKDYYDSEFEAIVAFQRSCAACGDTRVARVGDGYHITTLDSSPVAVPPGVDVRLDAIVIHLADGKVIERKCKVIPLEG